MLSVDLVIVDDDQLTLDIIAWNLRKSSVSYRLFSEPLEALEYLEGMVPSLLVVDNFMPLVDGMKLIETLAARGFGESSTVYLCSAANPPPQHIDQLMQWGAAVLDKSVVSNRRLLLALIDEVCNVQTPVAIGLSSE